MVDWPAAVLHTYLSEMGVSISLIRELFPRRVEFIVASLLGVVLSVALNWLPKVYAR
jgi:hypothetical protein